MISLNNKTIIITGGGSGLGKATALLADKLGAKVIIISRTEKNLQATCEESNNIEYIVFDFNNLTKIPSMLQDLAKKYGKISGFAHFAGIGNLSNTRTQPIQTTKAIFDVNFFSAYEIIKILMDKRVYQAPLSILLISSISSILSFEGITTYACSKGAINTLSSSLSKELAKYNIRINSILPGDIDVPNAQTIREMQSSEYKHELDNSYPLGRGKPQDIANLSVFLLSDAARWITGQNIVIDGGRSHV